MESVIEKDGITKLYPGHYNSRNPETMQRVKDMITLSKDVLSGKVKGEENAGNRFGLSFIVNAYGVRIITVKSHLNKGYGYSNNHNQ